MEMKNMQSKICASIVAATMAVSLSGCGEKQEAGKTEELNFQGYPIQSEETITYWMPLNGVVAQTADNIGNTPFGEELQKQTGVKIQFIHPPQGQDKDQFNIMLAGDDLPDVIEYDWFGFPGGPEKALQEEYILELNEIIE